MLVAKIFKKALLVLAIVTLLASSAMAAPSNSALTGGRPPSGDESLVREIKGGLMVQFKGISKVDGFISVVYIVTSDKDQVIEITANGADLFDLQGMQLQPYWSGRSHIWIGNHRTTSREIIEGVPTVVAIHYNGGDKYEVHESYARLTFIINGEKLVFRNIPSQTE